MTPGGGSTSNTTLSGGRTARHTRFGEETAIVVERYDRIKAGSRLARLHQEDLCQALGRSPLNKYESEGGPGCREIARAIRSHCGRPGDDLPTFVKVVALNRVLGGTDAHARNFSLLIGAGGKARLDHPVVGSLQQAATRQAEALVAGLRG
ncbi:MAG: HipA domain-containing protein [Gemmatimonadetes bacterium]|nr:HipA domain-containing protein [Gemmatimonadota bacterium]MCY3944159.1 HipA domain-containing protein [Gemmatimonadota bacterium]